MHRFKAFGGTAQSVYFLQAVWDSLPAFINIVGIYGMEQDADFCQGMPRSWKEYIIDGNVHFGEVAEAVSGMTHGSSTEALKCNWSKKGIRDIGSVYTKRGYTE